MCLIVDANMAARVFVSPVAADFAPIHAWLAREGRVVHGGKLKIELTKINRVGAYLVELNRAGRAIAIADEEVAQEAKEILALGLCKSDDEHVLALANASGARVLCTDDASLMSDFKNTRIVRRPQGRVYRRREHEHILGHSRSCPHSRRGAQGRVR